MPGSISVVRVIVAPHSHSFTSSSEMASLKSRSGDAGQLERKFPWCRWKTPPVRREALTTHQEGKLEGHFQWCQPAFTTQVRRQAGKTVPPSSDKTYPVRRQAGKTVPPSSDKTYPVRRQAWKTYLVIASLKYGSSSDRARTYSFNAGFLGL